MKSIAAARTCSDVAADLRLRIWQRGGRWALFLDTEGKPCFAQLDSVICMLLERMTSLRMVGVYDRFAPPEIIAGDIAELLA